MSVSLSVVGIKPPDEKWKKMKAVRDSCLAAGIPIPKEIEDFFCDDEPDDKGVRVYLGDEYAAEKTEGVQRFLDKSSSGLEIDLTKLPKDITIIRATRLLHCFAST